MDYRMIQIEIEHEEPIVMPIALLEGRQERVVIRVLTSASDPFPRKFVLRRTGTDAVMLVEQDS